MNPQSGHITQWLNHLDEQGKSPHTIAAYRRALRHFDTWNQQMFQAAFVPAAIIPRDVRDWLTYQRQAEKAAPSTVNQRLTALSRFFRWAVSIEIADKDPTMDIKTIRVPRSQPKALTESDLRHLLRAVHQSGHIRDIALVEVMVGTGIRVGELLALEIGDIEIRDRSGKLIVREGKHGNYRNIPLTKEVRQALNDYLAEHPDLNHPDASVWKGIHGDLSHRSTVLRILKRYTQQSNIGHVTPHQLRHTFATRYLAANPDDLRGLATLLGHSSLDTIMIYTEPSINDLTQRMERVEYHNRLSWKEVE